MRRAGLLYRDSFNLLTPRIFGLFAASVLVAALSGCVGGGGGGGGGFIFVPCQGDADCNGGKCVNGQCAFAAADGFVDGQSSSGGPSDAASSGGASSGADGASSGGASSGGASSGGDGGASSGGASSGGDGGTSGASSSGSSGGEDTKGGCKSASECNDDNPCTADSCPDGECVNKVQVEAKCDDGDACTKNDQCNEQGKCEGKGGVCCKGDGDCQATSKCQIGACNTGTGKCEYYNKPNCCQSAEDCSTDGVQPCQQVYCNEITGSCDVKNKADGANCEDGDECTANDKCVTGICVGPAKSCDDGDKCTTDACVNGGCTHTPIPGCSGGACQSGTCCLAGNFAPKGTKCGTSVQQTQYQCSGNMIQRRYAYYGCPGNSAGCSSSSAYYHYTSWVNYKSCTSGQTCSQNGTTATCMAGGGDIECTSGQCCDTFTKKFRPKGYKCGTSSLKAETKCVGTNYTYRRYAYYGCTGASTSCSSSSSYYHYTPWSKYQTCSSTYACYTGSSTSAYCTSKKYCSSGTCCDTSKKAIQPKYTKCGTSVTATEYRCYNGAVQTRKQYHGCSGSSTSCSSSTTYRHWTDWSTVQNCGSGTKCVASGTSSAKCEGSSGGGGKQCTSGTCCNTTTGKFRPKGYQCSSSALKYEYKCASAKYGYRRTIYSGCSGTSSSCTSSSLHYAYSGWSTYKTCSSYKTACYVPAQISTTAPTCKSGNYCSSGTCCYSTNKTYYPKYHKCSSTVKSTQYRCYQGAVQYRQAFYGCSGTSTTCQSSSSYYHWGDWVTSKMCASGQVCKENGSTTPATCVSDGGGSSGVVECTSGTCCDLATKRFKPKREKCGTSTAKYEYKCSGAGSKTMYRRQLYYGCSGYSSTCSTSSNNYWEGAWSVYKTCASGTRCHQSSSASATCVTTTSSSGKCSSGTCCHSSYKYYQPAFYQCSSTIKSTEYKCDNVNNRVLRRQAKQGCSGYSTSCTTNSTTYVWDSWITYKNCASSQYCKQVSSSSAGCYSLPAGT